MSKKKQSNEVFHDLAALVVPPTLLTNGATSRPEPTAKGQLPNVESKAANSGSQGHLPPSANTNLQASPPEIEKMRADLAELKEKLVITQKALADAKDSIASALRERDQLRVLVDKARESLDSREKQLKTDIAACDQRSKELQSKESNFERRRQRIENELEQNGNRLDLERKEFEATKEKLKQGQNRNRTSTRALNKEIAQLQTRLEDAAKRSGMFEKQLEKLKQQPGSLFEHSPCLADWLEELEPRESFDVWGKDIVTTGNTPFAEDFFDSLLRSRGYAPVGCGVPEAGVMIVGREDWTEDELEEQIEARAGDTLKVYSQEMALLALLTGHDLFDAGRNVLVEFAKDHSALQFLMGLDFAWPKWNFGTGMSICIDAQKWRDGSPLTAMGYHVGETSVLNTKGRRNLLARIFTDRLRFPDDFSEAEQNEWGNPSKPTRLRMIAEHIANNIAVHGGRLGHSSLAVKEWKADLAWMKKKFYDDRHRFRWPDIRVYK